MFYIGKYYLIKKRSNCEEFCAILRCKRVTISNCKTTSIADDLGALKHHVMKMVMQKLMAKGKWKKQHSEL